MAYRNVQSLHDNSGTDTLVPPDEVDGGTICIQGLSVFGHNYPQASPNGTLQAKPSSIPAGSVHTISAAYAAKVLGIDQDTIDDSASHGKVFCRLAWTFPNHQYPRFTTRHVLAPGAATDISFSGGLGWALKQLAFVRSRGQPASLPKAVQPRRPPGTSVQVKRPPRTLSSKTFGTGSPGLLQSANGPLALPRRWSESLGSAFLPPARSLTSSPATFSSGIPAPTPLPVGTQAALASLGSAGVLRDVSIPFEPGGLVGVHTQTPAACGQPEKGDVESTTSPGPLTRATSRESTPCSDSDTEPQQDAAANDPQIQAQIERLRQKRRAAEVLYASIGDTSGYTALLRHTAQHSELWYPSGRPRF